MKKYFPFTFITLLLAICFISSVFGDTENANVYVLGYPRSGTHWIRLCLKKLLSDAAQNKNSSTPPSANFFDYLGLEYQAGDHHIYFGHNPVRLGLDKVDQTKNYLILIIRNYRECIMRHHADKDYQVLTYLRLEDDVFSFMDINPLTPSPNYIANVKYYDEWNPKNRFLIYYEDLILEPEKTLKGLMKFLDQDETLVDTFMAHYKEMQNISYSKYKNTQSYLGGINHHTSLMSKEIIFQCDEFVKNRYPQYWDKYLSRFEWQKNKVKN